MSLPWILTDHILETKEPSMMELVSFFNYISTAITVNFTYVNIVNHYNYKCNTELFNSPVALSNTLATINE